jgi:hypothetical protein
MYEYSEVRLTRLMKINADSIQTGDRKTTKRLRKLQRRKRAFPLIPFQDDSWNTAFMNQDS